MLAAPHQGSQVSSVPAHARPAAVSPSCRLRGSAAQQAWSALTFYLAHMAARSTQTTPRSHFETCQTIWAPTTRIGHTLRRYLQDTPVISGRPGFVKSPLRLSSLAHLLTNVFGCTLFCPHPSVHSFSSCLMF